ncbi:MAG: murein transglycosylase A [Burkholderiaceae bacterium]
MPGIALSIAMKRALMIACLGLLAACATSRSPAPKPATRPVQTPAPSTVPAQALPAQAQPAQPVPAQALPAPSQPAQPLQSLPGWAQDDLSDLDRAIARQCALRTPPEPWPTLCAEFRSLPQGAMPALRAWLERRFVAQGLGDGSPDSRGLITGYYEPLIRGSRQRLSSTQVPIYAPPRDLITVELASIEPRLSGMRLRGRLQGDRLVPYADRAEIERKGLPSADVLLWADDPVDAFFLEIQGSGRVQLRDGSVVRIGYANQNGHPFRAIGRTLIDRGLMAGKDVTAPGIRAWLRANPGQARELMHTNPSQVFFRELPTPADPSAGPPGAMGVPLTPMRSIAVDRRQVPLGSLVWLATREPMRNVPLERLMLAQDVGGAIVGAVRADVFWGFGEQAGDVAGRMKADGRMWVLVPR